MAIRTVRSARMPVMVELSGDVRLKVNIHARSCDRGASNRRI
jgi:hypothetical protein